MGQSTGSVNNRTIYSLDSGVNDCPLPISVYVTVMVVINIIVIDHPQDNYIHKASA